MARQLAETHVARLLAALGLAVLAGLLPIPWIDVAMAILVMAVGLGVVATRPRGNRVLGFGVAALGALLFLVAWRLDDAPAIRNTLAVVVAAILLVAAWLKHQGKW